MDLLRTTCSLLLLTPLLCAAVPHGGQYRGPTPPVQLPVAPLPGNGRGGLTPPPPAPTTGTRDLAPDARTWQTWWEFNKEPFLLARVRDVARPVTGSDDFYLGQRQPNRLEHVLRATASDRADRIAPALLELLDRERNRDVQSATLIALGKLGVEVTGGLEATLTERLRRGDQEVREAAVLALGIASRREGFEVLLSLLGDDDRGRQLVGRDSVRKRTRAFAAYGLGLMTRRLADPPLARRTCDALLLALQTEGDDRELGTAIVNALGILRADPSRAADKRLGWRASEALLAWFARDLGSTAESVQAHAPIAIARLLGRGDSSLHRRCKQQLLETLTARDRRGAPILQSCAVALGMLALPVEQCAADAAASGALRACWQGGHDQTARQLAAIALGRIGGRANRDWLLSAYVRANRASEQPWLALALGVASEPAGSRGQPDAVVGQLLLDELGQAASDDRRSALAVALGLSGYQAGAPSMLRLLRDHEADQRSAGYLCIGLGLLRDPSAVSMLTEVLARSKRRPFVLQQCAVALGCLGDRHANELLVSMLRESEGVAVLAAIAVAIGRIGDRRAIDALLEGVRDDELTRLARAFVAAALGGVGDKDRLPWNVPFSVDCNYATGMDTLTNGRTGVLDIL